VDRWEEVLWTKMDCERLWMGLGDLAARCRKMPKGPRDWPAHLELRQVIEDLRITLPPPDVAAGPLHPRPALAVDL
jgi:hypothetical protein